MEVGLVIYRWHGDVCNFQSRVSRHNCIDRRGGKLMGVVIKKVLMLTAVEFLFVPMKQTNLLIGQRGVLPAGEDCNCITLVQCINASVCCRPLPQAR